MKQIDKAAFSLIVLIMITLAFTDGILGIFLPQIKVEFGINNTRASAIFTANLLGFIIFTPVGGHLNDRIGSRKSFLLLLCCLLLACSAMLFSQTYVRLMVFSTITYCILAALTVTVNSSIPTIFVASQAFFMSFFHLVNYGGMALSKLTAGAIVRLGVNWRYFYVVIIFIILTSLVCLRFSAFSTVSATNQSDKDTTSLQEDILSTDFFLFVVAVGGYLSSITAMQNWYVNYACISFGTDASYAASIFSLFFLFSAVGNSIFARMIQRVGKYRIVFWLSASAAMVFLIGFILGQHGLYIIALCGLPLSVTYPTTLVNIHSSFPVQRCFVMGLIVAAGSTMNLIFTLVLGYANDILGTQISFILVLFGMSAFAVSNLFIYMRRCKSTGTFNC